MAAATRREGALLLCVLLAACAGAGAWTKPGADTAAAARAHDDCARVAAAAAKTDAEIDEDIRATRHGDWQRAGDVWFQEESMASATRRRAAAIIARCMAGKGFQRSG